MDLSDEDIRAALRRAPRAAVDRLIAGVGALREVPPVDFVSWVAPRPLPDGALALGYPQYAPAVAVLHQALYEAGAVVPFDWGSWTRFRRFERPEDLADASVADAARFVTAVLRSEHFGDGAMQTPLENGTLVAAAGRIAEWQLTADWVRRHDAASGRSADQLLPGTSVTENELRQLGFRPHELIFADFVAWDNGSGINWDTDGDVPNSPGLYAFTVSDEVAFHVVYVGKASQLCAIAKRYDPIVRKSRPGQRYGRPKFAGVTRKRINSLIAAQHRVGRHVQHWFRAMPSSETAAEESRLIAVWQLRTARWNIKA